MRVSEAQALEAFEYLHDYADKYPDNKDYTRTNFTNALRRATGERNKPRSAKASGEPIVHKVNSTGQT